MGVSKPGSSTDQLIETVDIYPTIVDLAGLDLPDTPQPIDGTNMRAILDGSATSIKDHIYHSYPRGGYMGQAIRTDRYRLIAWSSLKDPDTDLIYELYDYEKDPLETVNSYKKNPKVAEKLRAIVESYPKPAAPLKR